MEFVSDSEYITTLLLIPIFSIGLFLLIAFIEILDKHGEILFINKKHAYTNKDFIFPLVLAVLVGLSFYGLYFELEDYFNSFPPVEIPPQPCAEFSGFDNASKHRACIKQYVEDHSWTIWDLF
jgi:hypothetical protein